MEGPRSTAKVLLLIAVKQVLFSMGNGYYQSTVSATLKNFRQASNFELTYNIT